MDTVPCLGCNTFFLPRNKLQVYCSAPFCQRARKALWQRQKLANDPEYAQGQKLSNNKWLANNPNYWKDYRSQNPEKTARNRVLQQIRNRSKASSDKGLDTPRHVGIAKMDSGTGDIFLCYTRIKNLF